MQRLPHKPEDWPGVFAEHLNAGDLDSVMAIRQILAAHQG